MAAVDLNADLGEGGAHDDLLLDVVTSANVACGGHAGDEASVRATVGAAAARGVSVGAHPSYADRAGFGRRRPPGIDLSAVPAIVVDQVALVARACADAGVPLAHVKPHGALYHDAADDVSLAIALVGVVVDTAPGATVVGPAGTALEEACVALGAPFAAEVFADRAYGADGRLLSRDRPGALLSDPLAAARQAVAMVTAGRVPTADGGWHPVRADTICVHGDSPGAAVMARSIREALAAAGVQIRPLPPGAP